MKRGTLQFSDDKSADDQCSDYQYNDDQCTLCTVPSRLQCLLQGFPSQNSSLSTSPLVCELVHCSAKLFKVHCEWRFPVNVLQRFPLQCTSMCTLYIAVNFIVSLQWQYTKWCHDWVPSLQLTSLPPIVPLRLHLHHHHHHHHLHSIWFYHYYQKLCHIKSISHSNFLLFPFKSCCHLLLLPSHCPLWPTNIFQHRQHCCT